jgi:hypothetical protein
MGHISFYLYDAKQNQPKSRFVGKITNNELVGVYQVGDKDYPITLIKV